MAQGYGCQSMVAPLRRVLVRRPDAAFGAADPRRWHYAGKPDLPAARKEHDAFVRALQAAGAEILVHDERLKDKADAMFVHDPGIVTDAGAVLLRMGKALRRGEEAAMGKALEAAGVRILGSLRAPAVAEGGDLVWLDHDTLAVGQGFRTNVDGLRQLDDLLRGLDVDTVPVPLPYHEGPEACLHLMSLLSLVDDDLAVVYPRLLPVPLWDVLGSMGIELVEVPDDEFRTMGPNVLALAPRRCLMLEGNPVTRERLEEAGCRVSTYRGREISMKAEGGPTCLTRPVLRSA
ncbi:MAG TPA: arginine deiminase family protein [Thermoplasmata archaeon]|nr:arginine deiminase family protein [Thermoplasmata archaeon]